ncbi:MAG: outer membrane beta-barrel protein [Parvibaculales bacterium]
MRYCHLLSVAFAFGFLFTAAPAQADSRMDKAYVSVAAIVSSDFEFAGDINGEQEEGSGFMLGVGYRQGQQLSYELAYTQANDYANDQGSYSKVYHWEAVALLHPAGEHAVSPYLRAGLYHARSRSNLYIDGISTVSGTSDKTEALIGAGVDYRLAPGRLVRLDFTRGGLKAEDRLDRLSLGLVMYFGGE